MPGLQRDVLRWLVALNLLFPIKNIKRDFSNGFMVAEIFSRYYPQDIHMHSYDYGSRLVTKKDNWEQLKKFFRKKGFTVVNDEIDNIIQCTSDDGAAPLLERMYSFLTQKLKLPENTAKQDTSTNQDCSLAWNNEPAGKCSSHDEEDESSSTDGGTYVESEDELDNYGTCTRLEDDTCRDEAYHGDGLVRLRSNGCGYEFEPLVRLDVEEAGEEVQTSIDSGGRCFLDDGDHQEEEEQEEEQNKRVDEQDVVLQKKYVNAVEKARQKEDDRARRLKKGGKTRFSGTQINPTTDGRKSCSDAALAFRSPNRSRKMNFKQYTLPDYRRQMQFGYVKLGSLGPKDDPELISKRQVLARVKEFDRHTRSGNMTSHPNLTLTNLKSTSKPSSRKVALEFASSIPKPKRKKHQSKEKSKKALPVPNCELTDLQILEMKHQSHKEHVEVMRRDLEYFLR